MRQYLYAMAVMTALCETGHADYAAARDAVKASRYPSEVKDCALTILDVRADQDKPLRYNRATRAAAIRLIQSDAVWYELTREERETIATRIVRVTPTVSLLDD